MGSCDTITITEPDESELSVSLDSLSSPVEGVVDVSYTVTNTVTSGSGKQLTGTVEIAANDTPQSTIDTTVSAGSSTSNTQRIPDLPPSEVEVCVRFA